MRTAKSLMLSFTALAGAAALSTTALAQQTETDADAAVQTKTGVSAAGMDAEARTDARAGARMRSASSLISAEEFVGAEIQNARNERIGEVKDLWIDASGQAQAVVTSSGGLAGVGGKTATVKFSSQSVVRTEDDRAVYRLAADEEDLKSLPEFEEGENAELRLASEILGSEVEFSGSTDEATITDLLMSADGRIESVVIKDGIVAGVGGEPREIAFSQLKVADEDGKYMLDMTPEEFRGEATVGR